MRNRTLWYIIAIAIVGVFIVVIYLSQRRTVEGQFTIGVIVPLTGSAGELGAKAKEGIEVAKALFPIRVIYEDSRTDPKEGLTAYQRLKALHGNDLVGVVSFMSSVGNAFIPLAERDKIVSIHIASAPDLVANKQYAFRWYITSDDQMKYIVKYLKKRNIDTGRIVFLYINDDYGRGSLIAFEKALAEEGIKSQVFSDAYEADQTDFKSLLAKIKNLSPNVIAIVGYSKSLGILIRQIKEMKINAHLIGDDSVSYPDILAVAGKAADGFVFAGIPLETIPDDSLFFKKYASLYPGKQPSDFTIFAYGAVSILVESVQAVRKNKATDIASYIKTSTFETPLGKVHFQDNSGTIPLVYKTIRDGKVVILSNDLTTE